jgi:CheY-like chemotaxis protein/transposase-like protein
LSGTGSGSDPSDRSSAEQSAGRPIYSIGAVARMLGVEPATLRAWEDRYRVVAPARSQGSHRLYSRDHVEQLRFVLRSMEDGSSAADAHRLLAAQLDVPADVSVAGRDVVVLILLAERDRFAAELCEYLLRAEGYDVRLASSLPEAERRFVEHRPNLSVVELMLPGGLELCRRLARDDTVPVLAVSVLALQDQALTAGASAFLQKPFEQLQFVSSVQDLLGASALTRPDGASVS